MPIGSSAPAPFRKQGRLALSAEAGFALDAVQESVGIVRVGG
jgi:hypothetical protein